MQRVKIQKQGVNVRSSLEHAHELRDCCVAHGYGTWDQGNRSCARHGAHAPVQEMGGKERRKAGFWRGGSGERGWQATGRHGAHSGKPEVEVRRGRGGEERRPSVASSNNNNINNYNDQKRHPQLQL